MYDPWNRQQREDMSFDLFPASELYYHTEESLYEDDDPGHDQHLEEQEDDDEQEVPSRSPSFLRSQPPLRMDIHTIEEEQDDDEEEAPSRSSSTLRSQPPLNRSLSTIEEEDEDEVPLRSLSPSIIAASLPHSGMNIRDQVIRQPYALGFLRIPVQYQGIRRRRDEEDDNHEAHPNRRQRASPVEEP